MKKAGTIILTMYLTLVTILAVFFGFLYFSTRKGGEASLSKIEANTLVNTICYDLGWITKEDFEQSTTPSTTSAISINALPYTDYTSETISDEDFPMSAVNYKQYLFMAREVLNANNDYSEGKFYKSSVTYFEGTDYEFTQVYYLTYELKEKELLLYFTIFTETNDGNWVGEQATVQITQPEGEKWGLACAKYAVESDLVFQKQYTNYENAAAFMLATANAIGIKYANISILTTSVAMLQNELTANQIESLIVSEINTYTHQKLEIDSSNFSSLSSEEKLKQANYVKTTIKATKRKSFKNVILIDSNYANVMKEIVEA